MSGEDDGFLKRWERRKAAVAEEAAAPVIDDPAPEPEPETRSDEEILAELGLKHPDQLEAGDDFKAFLASAVPAHLRRLALRKLWLSNPALANLDGLVEYGEDYTDAATVIENMQTAYQVGKGMVRKVEEAVEAIDDALADAGSQTDQPQPESGAGGGDTSSEDTSHVPEPVAEAAPSYEFMDLASNDSDFSDQVPPPGRHRMQFRIPEK